MLRPCIICFKLAPPWGSERTLETTYRDNCPKEEKLPLNLFFKLLERYLNNYIVHNNDSKGDDKAMRFLLEKVINVRMVTCEDCSKIVKSFCKYYHQMKSIEVILNWKLGIFKEIMRTGSTGVNDLLMDFKIKLMKRCTRKLENAFPKISLRRTHSQKRKVTFNETAGNSNTSHNRAQDQIDIRTESKKSSFCLFCNALKNPDMLITPQNGDDAATNIKITASLKRFLILLGRHLDENNFCSGNERIQLQPKNLIFSEMFTCGNCLNVMASFCELYHKKKSFEVLLNSELWKLWDSMSTSQQSPSRMSKLRKEARLLPEVEDFGPEEIIILIIDFKSNLIKNCDKKLRMTFPRVTLQVYQPKLNKLISTASVSEGFVKPNPPKRHNSLYYRKNIIPFHANSRPVLTYSKSENATRASKMSKLKTEADAIKTEICNEDEEEADSMESEEVEDNIIPNDVKLKLGQQPLLVKRKTRDLPTYSDEANPTMTTPPVSKDPPSQLQNPLRTSKSKFNPKTGKFQCTKCAKEFSSKPGVYGHYDSSHLNKRKRCRFCEKDFVNLSSLNEHIKTIHPTIFNGQILKCCCCTKQFTSRSELRNHQRNTQHKIFQLLVQNEDGKTEKNSLSAVLSAEKYREIWKTRSSINPKTGFYVCHLCKKEYESHYSFKNHYRSKHMQKNYSCDYCDKTFPGLCRLRKHKKSCAKINDPSSPNSKPNVQQKHKCSSCPKEYISKYELKYHYQNVHEGVTYPCDRCKKLFTSKSYLQMHHRTTKCALRGLLPVKLKHMCDVCGQGFTRSTILRNHLNGVHLKLQENVCSYCGRRFSHESSLKRHVETIHLEKREHLCDLCGMGFKWKSSLDGHRRNVHGETSKTAYAPKSRNAIISVIETDKSMKESVTGMTTSEGQGFPTAAVGKVGDLTYDETSGIGGPLTDSTVISTNRIQIQNQDELPVNNIQQKCQEDEDTIRSASPLDLMEEVGSPEVQNEDGTYEPDPLSYLQESSSSIDWNATFNKIKSSSSSALLDVKDADIITFPKPLGISANENTPAASSSHISESAEQQPEIEFETETPETYVVNDSANTEGKSKNKIEPARTSSRLRSLHRCKLCTKTFSTSTKLEEHNQSHTPQKKKPPSDLHIVDSFQIESSTDNTPEIKKSRRKTLHIPNVTKTDLETGPPLTISGNVDTEMWDSDVKVEPSNSTFNNVDSSVMGLSADPNEVSTNIIPCESKQSTGNPTSVFNLETGKQKCTLCPKEFSHKYDARLHYSRIHEKVRHLCPTCGRRFGCQKDYQVHWRRIHSGIPYQCMRCNKTFALQHHLTKHFEITQCTASNRPSNIQLVIPPSIVENCEGVQKNQTRSTDNSNKIKKSQRKPTRQRKFRKCSTNSMSVYNNKTGKYKCSYCPQEFTFKCDAITHYKRRHVQDRYVCSICGKKFLSERDYQKHWRIVHSGVTYKCLGCNTIFKQMNGLTNHYRSTKCTASQGKETITPTERVLPIPPSIIQHCIQDEEPVKDPLITICVLGNLPIPTSPRMSINPKTGKYKCSLCEKEYTNVSQCKYHYEAVHLGVKYKCDICNQLFALRTYLRQHQRFKCFPIGKSLADKDRHVCDSCGKVFSKPVLLRRHVNTVHLKLQDNVCSYCGRRFSQDGSLQRHIKTVHLEQREHLCDLCGKGFKWKFSLTNHRRSVHGESHKAKETQPSSNPESSTGADELNEINDATRAESL